MREGGNLNKTNSRSAGPRRNFRTIASLAIVLFLLFTNAPVFASGTGEPISDDAANGLDPNKDRIIGPLPQDARVGHSRDDMEASLWLASAELERRVGLAETRFSEDLGPLLEIQTSQIDLTKALTKKQQEESESQGTLVLEAAHIALDHREGLVPTKIPTGSRPLLDHQHHNVHASKQLLAIKENQKGDGFGTSVALAKAATTNQAQILDLSLETLVPVQLGGYERPSRSLERLAERYDVQTPSDRVQPLDDLDEPLRGALARFVDAYLAMESAAWMAYQGAESLPGAVDEASPGLVERSGSDADIAKIFSTRIQFLDAMTNLHEALGMGPVTTSTSCDPIEVPPAFSIDLTDCDNVYTEDYSLVFDAGGSDWYRNNAGGSGLDAGACGEGGSGAVVDFGGSNDRFGDPEAVRDCGANGGGDGGSGFLFAEGGSNTYTAGSHGTNGGGHARGVGFLVDATGDDTYLSGIDVSCEGVCEIGSLGVNGGGSSGGIGFLLDGDGNDRYTAGSNVTCESCGIGSRGVNGGGDLGVGFLFDAMGDDVYRSGTMSDCDTCEVGSQGVNGGGHSGGFGFLVDADGKDRYITGSDVSCRTCEIGANGVNGGASTAGNGFLFDAGGRGDLVSTGTRSDCTVCAPGSQGVNGGGYFGGVGVLLNDGGDDKYVAGMDMSCGSCRIGSRGVHGGGYLGGTGFLLDAEGDDQYTAGDGCDICPGVGTGGVNGGGETGVGFLFDGGGDDSYTAGVNATCSGHCWIGRSGINGAGLVGGVGFLFDSGGDDTYRVGADVDAQCQTAICTVGGSGINGGGDTGGVGFLVDAGGDDAYLTATNVRCSGATLACKMSSQGVNGGGYRGAGFLLDAGGHDIYVAGGNVDCTDSCWIASRGANGGAHTGSGFLFDAAGDDDYLVHTNGTCDGDCDAGFPGANGAGETGIGLILDLSGEDFYEDPYLPGGSCTDCTVVPKGTAGAQVDTNDLSGP